MIFRVHYLTTDIVPHVYCRVFASESPNTTFAALGNLTMRKPEFEAFRKSFNAEFVQQQDDP